MFLSLEEYPTVDTIIKPPDSDPTSVNDREHIEAVLKLKPTGYLLKPAVKQRRLEAVGKAIL